MYVPYDGQEKFISRPSIIDIGNHIMAATKDIQREESTGKLI